MGNGVAKADCLNLQTIAGDQDAITARTKYVGAIDGTNMSLGVRKQALVYGEDNCLQLRSQLISP